MLSKKEIKDIQSLSQKKFRNELKLAIAEGPKIVSELVTAIPERIEKIYAVNEWIQQATITDPSMLVEISEAELQKISQLQTPNKVIALVRQWDGVRPEGNEFALYLDTIQDPGNLGAIIRIADWFGVKHIVCSAGCAELFNPKVVQSTMASIARVNVYYDENEDWLEGQNMPVYAAVLDGVPVYDIARTREGVLLIGNESKGIRESLLQKAAQRITIPKTGEAESLNAAVATGIILSHLIS